jgi:membrane protein DedA with SNARE-associated domain
MKMQTKLPAALVLLTAPLAAYAQQGEPHIIYSLVASFAGGFLGAALACWLCNRSRSKNDADLKR